MDFKKSLCAVAAAASIGLLADGCEISLSLGHNEKSYEEKPKNVSVYAKPVSVAYSPYTYEPGAFAGVFEVDGKLLLAYQSNINGSSLKYIKAAALVQSEINDGDDELVKLTGQYKKDELELSSIEANGYKIDF